MSERPDGEARRGFPQPPKPNMKRELIGSVLGAIGGAMLAQALGHNEQIASAAIAGAFVGPGLIAFARRVMHPDEPRHR